MGQPEWNGVTLRGDMGSAGIRPPFLASLLPCSLRALTFEKAASKSIFRIPIPPPLSLSPSLWDHPHMTSAKYSVFWTPSQLPFVTFRIQSTSFLSSAFLDTPLPHTLRTSYVYAPFQSRCATEDRSWIGHAYHRFQWRATAEASDGCRNLMFLADLVWNALQPSEIWSCQFHKIMFGNEIFRSVH